MAGPQGPTKVGRALAVLLAQGEKVGGQPFKPRTVSEFKVRLYSMTARRGGIRRRLSGLTLVITLAILAGCGQPNTPTPTIAPNISDDWDEQQAISVASFVTKAYRAQYSTSAGLPEDDWRIIDAYLTNGGNSDIPVGVLVSEVKWVVSEFWAELAEKEISRMERVGIHRWDEILGVGDTWGLWFEGYARLLDASNLGEFLARDSSTLDAWLRLREMVDKVMESHAAGSLQPRFYEPRPER